MSSGYAVFHKQLGDLVLLEPAFRRLALRWGGPVWLMTRGGHQPLVSLMRDVIPQRGVALRPAREVIAFDELNKSTLRALLTPSGRRVLLAAEPESIRWFHHLVFSEIRGAGVGDRYLGEYFWDLVGGGDDEKFEAPKLERPPTAWAPGGIEAGGYILVNPTSGWKRKCWRPGRWVELIRELGATCGPNFLLTSGPLDWQMTHAREVERKCEGLARSLAGATSMENFLWLCANARLILTVDGSPAHLGRAFGVPSVALFGPTNLLNWHLESETSLAVQAPAGGDGVRRTKEIEVEPVLAAVRRIL